MRRNSAKPSAGETHAAIKRFYFARGGSEQGWRKVSRNPHHFNRVWRAMLRLPRNTTPPPKEYRS